MARIRKKLPWLVRVHYSMRTVSFGILFVAAAAQIIGNGYSLYFWGYLAAQFLIYPHVQYIRAYFSADAVKTEMNNLLVDSVSLGVFIAAIQFSQWIAFSAFLGTLINNTINKGWRGLPETILAIMFGIAVGTWVWGFSFLPDTNWYATFFCIICLSAYIVAIGNLGYSRNQQLRSTREELTSREQDLLAANDRLQKNLKEIAELQNQLQEQAIRDPLTGLYNRRYLGTTLDREIYRCNREGQPLALMMCDIDHFKAINDTYGHQAGDEILVQLGSLLRLTVRACDVACRYGGEEFLLLLPAMSLEMVQDRAEKLRQIFADTHVNVDNKVLSATISIGIAMYPEHARSAQELIRLADEALYQAKREGRNCVIVSAENP